uniref:Uncharacterized protein n=1 Tax=Arundo donax TaxID=35708 RepID=A0A0A8YDN3_ARUDO
MKPHLLLSVSLNPMDSAHVTQNHSFYRTYSYGHIGDAYLVIIIAQTWKKTQV